jgi:hypothetical protein
MAARIAIVLRGGFVESVYADEPLSVLVIDRDMDGVNSNEITHFTDEEGNRYPAVPSLLSGKSEFAVNQVMVDRLFGKYGESMHEKRIAEERAGWEKLPSPKNQIDTKVFVKAVYSDIRDAILSLRDNIFDEEEQKEHGTPEEAREAIESLALFGDIPIQTDCYGIGLALSYLDKLKVPENLRDEIFEQEARQWELLFETETIMAS